MRTGNPTLTENTFDRFSHQATGEVMTLQGTVNKTALLLVLTVTSAACSWNFILKNPALGQPIMLGGIIGGLILALIISFKPMSAPTLAPVYALVKGLAVGAISLMYSALYDGIVLQAAMLTFGVLFALLTVYRTGLIEVTQNFRLGVVAATGGIFLVYLATLILGFFGIQIPYIHGSGWIGIGFSVFVVVLASLNLVLDFDFIEKGAEHGAPKFMEWYGAFGLMVTLIWLYIEILRLLAKIAARRN